MHFIYQNLKPKEIIEINLFGSSSIADNLLIQNVNKTPKKTSQIIDCVPGEKVVTQSATAQHPL